MKSTLKVVTVGALAVIPEQGNVEVIELTAQKGSGYDSTKQPIKTIYEERHKDSDDSNYDYRDRTIVALAKEDREVAE